MIVLDHNIPKHQADQLTRARLHWKQIGYQIGRPEWDDRQEIQRYLQANRRITFFSVLSAGVCNLGPGQVGAEAGARLASIGE